MELDWSTLLLEVINFLILIWILKRFLYQPVFAVIEQRRQKIEAEFAQASQTQNESELLKKQFETRLSDWQIEKRKALDELHLQIDKKRNQRIKQLNAELEQQRLVNRARDEQQQTLWRHQAESEALKLGSAFATRLLKTLSGPELDARLRQLFIEQISELPSETASELQQSWLNLENKIEIVSAIALDNTAKQNIESTLQSKFGVRAGPFQYKQDETLLAGLRLSIGGWILRANLRDELQFFGEVASRD